MFKTAGEQIWFFDCVRVPDPKTGRLAFNLPHDMPDREVVAEMLRTGVESHGSSPPQLRANLCRVVSVATLVRRMVKPRGGAPVDLENSVKLNLIWLPRDVENASARSEASIIFSFLDALYRIRPQLVGYNSKKTGLGVLFQRGLVSGVAVAKISSLPDASGIVYDLFSPSSKHHTDMAEMPGLSSNGAPAPLSEIAISSGIPGKFAMSCAKAAEMWLNGEWRQIVQKNCFGALTTYLLWLRAARFSGLVTDEAYEAEQQILTDTLLAEAERPEMEFLNSYIEEWERLRQAVEE